MTGRRLANDAYYVELGAAIRAAREREGQTQVELSAKVGLSRTSLTNIELGRQRLLVDQLTTLAHALNTDASALLPSGRPAGRAAADAGQPPSVQRFMDRIRSSGTGGR